METIQSLNQKYNPDELNKAYLAKITQARRYSRKSFKWFIHNIFSASFGVDEFIGGKYIDEVAESMEASKMTMDISARDHFKSTRLYAEVMYDIFTVERDTECRYFSYSAGMSSYHLSKIRRLIENNPFFAPSIFVNLSEQSNSIIKFRTPEGLLYEARAEGLLTFKRGIHAEVIYVDDPLKDPANKLSPTIIHSINNTMKTEMFPMMKKGGRFRVVGTPQTNDDFFFDKGLAKMFSIAIRPCIVNEAEKQVIWQEWKTYEELDQIRETLGEKAFNQEYLCKPAYSEDSYIERKDLQACVDKDLKPLTEYDGTRQVIAGYDIGKKAHPSHLAVFEVIPNQDSELEEYIQLESKFLDHIDYKDQIEYLIDVCERLKVDKLFYDNTRAEFELFAEQGLLPACMEPVTLSFKTNNALASNFNKVVQEGRLKLLPDQRQVDQILAVNNDLKAIESPMGHGDSFWSVAMALQPDSTPQFNITVF